jgi:hypothetical protein
MVMHVSGDLARCVAARERVRGCVSAEASATVTAVIAAIFAGVVGSSSLKREEGRDKAFAEREERQQAATVTGWVGRVPTRFESRRLSPPSRRPSAKAQVRRVCG